MSALRAIGSLWVLPATIITWALYILPMVGFGWYRLEGRAGFMVARVTVSEKLPAWLARLWRGWGGHAMPHAIIVKWPQDKQLERHELRHTDQWLMLGALFPFVYLILLIAYGYDNHPLERDAERFE